jgi:hypothetical protein
MKKTLLILCLSSVLPYQAMAASDDECAAWICSAGGFAPSACKPPKKAMLKRIKKGRSPLPPLSQCMAKDMPSFLGSSDLKETEMTYDYGYAALIRTKTCTKRQGKDHDCVAYRTDEYYQKGTRCHTSKDDRYPANCVSTKRYIQVFGDGKAYGDVYYW